MSNVSGYNPFSSIFNMTGSSSDTADRLESAKDKSLELTAQAAELSVITQSMKVTTTFQQGLKDIGNGIR
ncbi:hypothetical protein ASE80_05315 [Pseudomonas sp. Leaf15]|uniref:hypothetical protein n=1 Tax=unclassified Pseudomonas TaxID=196821 RepID=UPI000702E8DA|nr:MULTISPECIES: hypothetical protein [unclassified Pseudomonas]KQM52831.1 hypothetical protein ASE80_05315 [Pseudomonas sp. Leaf15]RAH03463.1 hypothetical protein DJ480_08955 [Pseudomonas sp. Leaf98]